MDKSGFFLCVLLVVLATMVSFHQTGALYVPQSKSMQATLKKDDAESTHKAPESLQTLKRAATEIKPARQKRYTDYQERASAFCTGLCMYEERKSYSDCFDMCNYY